MPKLSGWPTHNLTSEFQPYVSHKDELSVLNGCILWSSRVIVPPRGRQPLLEELHNTHLGASKMKALACSYIWWPGMDADIDNLVKSCSVCQQSALPQLLLPFTPENGPPSRGADCTLILRDPSWATCS